MLDESSILLEESSFLVLNKPAGLLTQAVPGVPSCETELRELLASRQPGSQPFVGLPHRLDRGTSGTLLIARHERALKRFGLQFQTRKVDKIYWALCERAPEAPSGTLVDFMRKIPERPLAECVPAEHPEAKQAILHYEVLGLRGPYGLVQVKLETGRMHQIRLQLSSRGWPVVGDWAYGATTRFGMTSESGEWQEFALLARSIQFRHPTTAVPIRVEADPPASWDQLIQSNG